jgi:hypothetical protein
MELQSMRALLIATAMLLTTGGSFGGAAKSRLADTLWAANTDCYITDLVLSADGRAGVLYQDGRTAGAEWMHAGTTLTLKFDVYDDTFTGRVMGSTIRATHTWRAELRDRTHQSEECVFHETFGGGI